MALEEGRFFVGAMTDKRYEADGLAAYGSRFLSSGVWELGANLQVTHVGGRILSVGFGAALVDGYPYTLRDNGTGALVLTAPPAHATLPRIDRVVIRMDTATLRVYACIKAGTPASSPEAPALERTRTVYEISLASYTMAAGASSVGTVTDERLLVVNPERALVTNADGQIAASAVTAAELLRLSGLSGLILTDSSFDPDNYDLWTKTNAPKDGTTLYVGISSAVGSVCSGCNNYGLLGITIARTASTSSKTIILIGTQMLSGTSGNYRFFIEGGSTAYWVRLSLASGVLSIAAIGTDTCITNVRGYH